MLVGQSSYDKLFLVGVGKGIRGHYMRLCKKMEKQIVGDF